MTFGFTLPSLIVLCMVAFDLQNTVAYFRRGVRPGTRSTDDFTILVPIYGSPEYLTNFGFLRRYKANTMLVVNATTERLVQWADGLEDDGWRIHRTFFPGKPTPPVMMRDAIGAVSTTYAVRLDGDSVVKGDLGAAVASVADHGKHLCSTRVLPSRRKTLAEKVQGVEYDIAMRNRYLRPWSTSGACHIGRTDAMRQILASHTCGYFAEDVEMGFLAKHFRMAVGYLDLTVVTDVPESFRRLGKQRRQWWAGMFQTTVVNADKMLYYPFRQLYYLGLVYLLFAERAAGLGFQWRYLPFIPLVYMSITTLVNWPVRSRWFLAFPFYMMLQSLIFPVVGTWWFVRMRRKYGLRARLRTRHRRETWTPLTERNAH